jgi:hypothetical protein
MDQHAKPPRATLIALLMLVALAEAAIAFDGSEGRNGDFLLEEARTAGSIPTGLTNYPSNIRKL